MRKNSDLTALISRLIGDWIQRYLPVQKVRSDKTIEAYEYALALFLEFLESEKVIDGLKIVPESFNRDNIEAWLLWLAETRGCCAGTCNNRLAAIRAFLKYVAYQNKSLAYLFHEAALVPQRKTYRKPVEGVSKKAMAAILSIPNQKTRTGKRDLALFSTMYNTAVRLDEILSLQIKDLKTEGSLPTITVLGKGSKLRTLMLMPKTVKHMQRYIRKFHGTFPKPNSYVFYSRNTGPAGKMSQVAVNKQLKNYARKSHESCPEVPVAMHAHQIRHGRASHWLEDGLNIVQISRLLGHSQIETTMVYLDVTNEMKAAALAKVEDDSVTKMPKKWKQDMNLALLCGIKPIKRNG